MCYSASSSELITDATPMANITSMIYIEHHGLSSGAVAGIVILVLVLVAAVAGAPQLPILAACSLNSSPCSHGGCTGCKRRQMCSDHASRQACVTSSKTLQRQGLCLYVPCP